jgi:hypothetical protein
MRKASKEGPKIVFALPFDASKSRGNMPIGTENEKSENGTSYGFNAFKLVCGNTRGGIPIFSDTTEILQCKWIAKSWPNWRPMNRLRLNPWSKSSIIKKLPLENRNH